MNRNVESHFSELPSIDVQRSIFDRSFTHKTSFNVGDLIPFFVDEVIPGDTFNITTSKVVRLQTLLTPVLDNLYLDTYFFFVPNRLIWDHWKEFCGENNTSPWIPLISYRVPTISAPTGGFASGTIADYMGLPVGVDWTNSYRNAPMALPFRAYALVANEFFRDENLTDPLNIPKGDSNQTGSNGTNYINDVANGGMPFKVAKYHDYFTSALPAPQKGPSVSFPLLDSGYAPVGTRNDAVQSLALNNETFRVNQLGLTPFANTNAYQLYAKAPTNPSSYAEVWRLSQNATATTNSDINVVPANLWADLNSSVGAVNINELRLAFQLQKYYERSARSGTRYTELLRSHFGVTSPDATLQRPEYLGGNRIPITIHEVTNTAQSSTDFLGDLGAMSVTSDIHDDLVHSFTEHGFCIGVCCLRYDHSYSQGLEKFWMRHEYTDFYTPEFASLGEMPIWKAEIYADSTNMNSDSVFGYQEAWADYRYKPDRISGEMRPGIPNTLASWHFGDYYASSPTLSDAWIREDKANVDRTLAVQSSNSNQAFADFYVKNFCTRVMPTYSIPGLIDHH